MSAQTIDNSEYQLTVSPSDPTQLALSRLTRWLAPSAEFRSVYIQYDFTGDHCLHALHPIPAKQTIVSVPLSHMLTLEEAKESSIGRQLTARRDDTSRHTYMAAYMLTELRRGRESAWRPYLQSLTASTAHLASAWSDEELRWLHGTGALRVAREQEQETRETHDQLRALPSFSFTYDSYAHARRLVYSRLFSYRTELGNRSSALVPMLELLNHAHDDSYNTLWTYNTTLHAFTLTTNVPLAPHQPLLISYGDKSNTQLLTAYGFVLENNTWDTAEVEYEGVDENGEAVFKTGDVRADYGDSRSQLMMMNMRRFALQDVKAMLKDRLQKVKDRTLTEADVPKKQRGIKVLVERRVLHRIVEAVRQADIRYGGDREADEQRLREWKGVKGKQWQALVVRVGERRVLQWWLDVCALGERWLADGANLVQLWESERAEVRCLKAQTLVKDVWVKVLEQEKMEEARAAGIKYKLVETN